MIKTYMIFSWEYVATYGYEYLIKNIYLIELNSINIFCKDIKNPSIERKMIHETAPQRISCFRGN